MSAFSDWKVGAITDDEYRMACEHEARRDRIREEELLDVNYECLEDDENGNG